MLKPPNTPMLPRAMGDMSMLFAQRPIFEDADDSMWNDDSVEIPRNVEAVDLPLESCYAPTQAVGKEACEVMGIDDRGRDI